VILCSEKGACDSIIERFDIKKMRSATVQSHQFFLTTWSLPRTQGPTHKERLDPRLVWTRSSKTIQYTLPQELLVRKWGIRNGHGDTYEETLDETENYGLAFATIAGLVTPDQLFKNRPEYHVGRKGWRRVAKFKVGVTLPLIRSCGDLAVKIRNDKLPIMFIADEALGGLISVRAGKQIVMHGAFLPPDSHSYWQFNIFGN
jgi:hypothetical protein